MLGKGCLICGLLQLLLLLLLDQRPEASQRTRNYFANRILCMAVSSHCKAVMVANERKPICTHKARAGGLLLLRAYLLNCVGVWCSFILEFVGMK